MMSNSSAVKGLSIWVFLSNAEVLQDYQLNDAIERRTGHHHADGSSTVFKNLSSSSPRAGLRTFLPSTSYPT